MMFVGDCRSGFFHMHRYDSFPVGVHMVDKDPYGMSSRMYGAHTIRLFRTQIRKYTFSDHLYQHCMGLDVRFHEMRKTVE